MAKLTKSEIHAISTKIHEELSKKRDLEIKKANDSYVPSADYKYAESLCATYKELTKKLDEIKNECSSKYNSWYCDSSIPDGVKNREIYSRFTNLPNINDIETDLIIAAIDSDFDVNNYIEQYILNR